MTLSRSELRRLRQARGITQKEIAKDLKVDFRTISDYERRKAIPSDDKLPALAKAYDVDVADLRSYFHPESPLDGPRGSLGGGFALVLRVAASVDKEWAVEEPRSREIIAEIPRQVLSMASDYMRLSDGWPEENGAAVLYIEDPSRKDIMKAVRFAEYLSEFGGESMAHSLADEFYLITDRIELSQFLVLAGADGSEDLGQMVRASSSAVALVSKKLADRPNIYVANDLFDMLMPEDVDLSAYSHVFEPNREDLPSQSLRFFRCRHAAVRKPTRFGIIPDLPPARFRQAETDAIVAALNQGGRQICWITGKQGAGGTTLALAGLEHMEAHENRLCFWYNCSKLLSFEFVVRSICSAFRLQLGADVNFAIDLLPYVRPGEECWAEEAYGVFLDGLQGTGTDVLIVFDNLSKSTDEHIRKFVKYVNTTPSKVSEAAGNVGVLCIATDDGDTGFDDADLKGANSHRVPMAPLTVKQRAELLAREFGAAGLTEEDVATLTKTVANIRLLRMLSGFLAAGRVTWGDVRDVLLIDSPETRDRELFRLLSDTLTPLERCVLQTASVLHPFLSMELLPHLELDLRLGVSERDAQRSLTVLHRELQCLQRYSCMGHEDWPHAAAYNCPGGFETYVEPTNEEALSLVWLAARFFEKQLAGEASFPRWQGDDFHIYRSYRYAMHYYQRIKDLCVEIGGDDDGLRAIKDASQLTGKWAPVLISSGSVVELLQDLARLLEEEPRLPSPDDVVDFHIKRSQLWRALFRRDLSAEPLNVIYRQVDGRKPRNLDHINRLNLERGINEAMARHYEHAFNIFRDPDHNAGQPLPNAGPCFTMRLRAAQALISLNAPMSAERELEACKQDTAIWDDLESWYASGLTDSADVSSALKDYVLGSRSRELRDTTRNVVSGLMGILRSDPKPDSDGSRDTRRFFAMKIRHRSTLAYLRLDGAEAMRSSLLCYIYNDLAVPERIGCNLSLIRLAKALCFLYRDAKSLEYADALADRAINGLRLRAPSLSWLGYAYWLKARIAIAPDSMELAGTYMKRKERFSAAHPDDEWWQHDDLFLRFLWSLHEDGWQEEAKESYESWFSPESVEKERKQREAEDRRVNEYTIVEANIELGHALTERGDMAAGLNYFDIAREEHARIWATEWPCPEWPCP